MSILIKGIEMPKEGRLTLQISADGAVYVVNRCNITAETYTTEAAPVPPHGRLIDADALRLLYDFNGYKPTGDMTEEEFDRLMYRLPVIRAIIDEAPTIIEAEEGE